MPRKLSAKIWPLAALPSLFLLTACETNGPATSVATCQIFKPISSSTKDTAQTRFEIHAHNAVGKRVCGWKVGKSA